MTPGWLWAAFTIAASGAQTARNAMQRDLIAALPTAGATFVRFVYGLPFAVLFLALASAATGEAPPAPGGSALLWAAGGGVAQIAATGLLLATMQARSFVVATAYTKTEPLLVALFGVVALGDHLSAAGWAAIAIATAGVVALSWPRGDSGETHGWRPALLGLSAAALFALSAVGYRAAIVALGAPSFVLGASTILALTLALQSALILGGLAVFDRALLSGLAGAWKPSLGAGFMGALASQFWFLAFALESAARVRTLALIEIPFAQIVSRRQRTRAREWLGMAMIIGGVALLLTA